MFINVFLKIFFYVFAIIIFLILAFHASILRLIRHDKEIMRILIAGKETSNNLRQISSLLSKSDKYAVSVCEFSLHPFFQGDFEKNICVTSYTRMPWDPSSIDILSCNFLRAYFLLHTLHKTDIVLFNWTDSFLPMNLDYLLFRISGARVFVRHCGSDVRYAPLQNHIHKSFGILQWNTAVFSFSELFLKLFRQTVAELFANGVISTRDHSTFQLRPIFCRPYIQNPLKRSTWEKQTKKIILHAPSDKSLKGSQVVIDAIEILRKSRSDFEFLFLTNQPHQTIFESLAKYMHFDRPTRGSACETGNRRFCFRMCCCRRKHTGDYGYQDCPTIQFPNSAIQLAETLDKLLSQPEKLRQASGQSYHFWKKNCSPSAFIEFFEALLAEMLQLLSDCSNTKIYYC